MRFVDQRRGACLVKYKSYRFDLRPGRLGSFFGFLGDCNGACHVPHFEDRL